MNDSFFKKMEDKTGVPMVDMLTLANAIQHADFKDEKQVKKIVRKVAKLANRPISKEVEEKIIKAVVAKGDRMSIQDVQDLLKRKN